jgi:sulfur relay (sulfurtransferase) DsrF/TusC family protein
VSDVRKARRISLLVRNHPYRRRAPRTDLDTALAAAALDIEVELYFLGRAVLQLAAVRDPEPALLPPGYRGWAALSELSDARLFADREWLQRCAADRIGLSLQVEALHAAEMARRWRLSERVLLW